MGKLIKPSGKIIPATSDQVEEIGGITSRNKADAIQRMFWERAGFKQYVKRRSFISGFETVSQFSNLGFFITTPGTTGATHGLSTDFPIDGTFGHKASLTAQNYANNGGTGTDGIGASLPHRAYPTVALYKIAPGGGFKTPCLITMYIRLNILLVDRAPAISDWFSPMTFTMDPTDNWIRVVTLTIGPTGYLALEHVPDTGQKVYIYQASAGNGGLAFPMNQNIRLDVFLDFNANGGYAKVWQNKTLVSHALISATGAQYNLNGRFAQFHGGMYSSAATHFALDGINPALCYNDKLRIQEVKNETDAMNLVNAVYGLI